ncbi:C-signal [Phymastichus coffea]|uniref:C-signal n=1 Tax=Phymastichus coffea TaxID=108790 RepID=UPI00273B9761|nr:C-signal [Phymastichus coffea]
MRSILITGCNRGLGFGLVKSLVRSNNPPEKIFATCRDVDKAAELTALAKEAKTIHVIEIDLRNSDEHPKLVKEVADHVGNAGLNVLFNNAGTSTKFARLPLVKEQQLTENFIINTVAPILLAKAFLPLLKQAAANHPNKQGMSIEKAAIINMSSTLGSITSNDAGGFYPYRCSKAALNAATKSMSLDLKNDNILVIAMHPGWVKTDMGGSNAPLDVETSTRDMLNTLESLTERHTGAFFQHDGRTLPW